MNVSFRASRATAGRAKQHTSQTDIVLEFDEFVEGVDTDYFPVPRHTVILSHMQAGFLKVQLEEALSKLAELARKELGDGSEGEPA